MEDISSATGTDRGVLCIHIGASSRHAAILDERGTVLCKEYVEAAAARAGWKYEELLRDAVAALGTLVERAAAQGMAKEAMIGGGVIVPGPVDPKTGYGGLLPSLPGLRNTYVARDLSQSMCEILGRKVPFWVENDANGAGLVEIRFGVGRNTKDFTVLLLGTGLGGALILDGRLYHGHTSMAGEVGHMTVAPQGPLCPCGSKGCLETVASGRALLLAVRNGSSALATRDNLHYNDIIDLARAGDPEIIEIFRTMGHYLGIGIASLVNILNPEKVVLSGQLARGADFLLVPVREEVRNRVFQGMDCDLEVSECLEDLEVRAALSTFLSYHCS